MYIDDSLKGTQMLTNSDRVESIEQQFKFSN